MKIRWTNYSVRLRITPGELTALLRGESVRETLPMGEGSWSAAIFPGQDATALVMEKGELRFLLAPDAVQRLAAPEAEGVYFQQPEAPGLRYYIEKDFPCEHPRPAEITETSETFPRPTAIKPTGETC